MKNRILSIAALILLVNSTYLFANEASVKDYANKFYQEWSMPRGRTDDGAVFMLANFNYEVPPSLQSEVINQMFNQACSATPQKNYKVIGYSLKYIESVRPDLVLTDNFKSNLYKLIKDPNWITRRDVLHFMGRFKKDEDRDLIIAALNDPQDEVRGAAISALRDRLGSEVIFQKYLQDHQSDPDHTTSAQYAQNALKAIHEKANSSK